MYVAVLVLALAWGVLAFGAVYDWAYQPLLVVLTLLGIWGLLGGRSRQPVGRPIWIGLFLVVVAVALQLVPLRRPVLLAISPAAVSLLRQYEVSYETLAASTTDTHSLSIEPRRTILALATLLSLAVFFLGLSRFLDREKLTRLIPSLIILGVGLSLIGIIQKPVFTGKIYGFWTPRAGALPSLASGGPFGPFINRNHFAGWMVMAIPLTLGYLAAVLQQRQFIIKQGLREHLLWLSSPSANRFILVTFAIIAMTLSLFMTLSRSGLISLVLSLTVSTSVIAKYEDHRRRRWLVFSILVVVLMLVAAWTGIGSIAARFEALLGPDREFRLGAWRDAIRIFRAFPLTGTGVNTYGIASLFYQTAQRGTVHFGEAHNDYLQLLAEGGLLVAVPALVLSIFFIREVHQRFSEELPNSTGYWLRLGAVTGIIGMMIQEFVEFSLQIPANAALFMTLCAIAARKSSISRPRQARV